MEVVDKVFVATRPQHRVLDELVRGGVALPPRTRHQDGVVAGVAQTCPTPGRCGKQRVSGRQARRRTRPVPPPRRGRRLRVLARMCSRRALPCSTRVGGPGTGPGTGAGAGTGASAELLGLTRRDEDVSSGVVHRFVVAVPRNEAARGRQPPVPPHGRCGGEVRPGWRAPPLPREAHGHHSRRQEDPCVHACRHAGQKEGAAAVGETFKKVIRETVAHTGWA